MADVSYFFGISISTLSYNKRNTFLCGLDALIAKRSISMGDEFSRESDGVDLKGVDYTLAGVSSTILSTTSFSYLCTKQASCTSCPKRHPRTE